MGNKAYKDLHISLGLCVDCSERALPDNIRCIKHKTIHNSFMVKYMRDLKKKRNREGKCSDCGIGLDPDIDNGYVRCQNCREELYFVGV